MNYEKYIKTLPKFSTPVRKIGWMVAKIAAVFLLLISIGGVWYYLQTNRQTFPVEIATAEQLEKGRGIVPDGTISEFETEQAKIQQTNFGRLTINNDTVNVNGSSIKSGQPANT